MDNKTYGTFCESRNLAKIMMKSQTVVIDVENQLPTKQDLIIIFRFPHLAENIFKELGINDLKTCLKVCRQWCNFIQNERFPWKRRIQIEQKIFKPSTNNENLNKILKKAPLIILQDLCIAIRKLDKIKAQNEFSPLHIAAETGMYDLCEFLLFKTDNKNPKNKYEATALHLACWKGHFEVVKIIFQQTEDKNPGNVDGDTPLHFAAKNGHLKICEYLIENGVDRNVENKSGQTPYDLAKSKGFFKVCDSLNPSQFWKRMFVKHYKWLLLLLDVLLFIGFIYFDASSNQEVMNDLPISMLKIFISFGLLSLFTLLSICLFCLLKTE